MQSFVSVSELARSTQLEPADYVVFGGTFDPFHRGHLDVVRSLVVVFRRVIIAPTRQNPWKDAEPAPFDARCEMIRLILKAEGLPLSSTCTEPGICIEETAYEFSADLVKRLRTALHGRLYWAVGEDSAEGVSQWKNFSELGVPVVTVPIRIQEHSTGIRGRSISVHPAIAEFIAERGLYR